MPARTRQPEPRVEVITDDAFAGRVPETLVEQAARAALAAERAPDSGSVTVFITGDDTLRDLNLRFNGLDEVTDVLSFNETSGNETSGGRNGRPHVASDKAPQVAFPDTPGEIVRLGDIVISLPQVERQARAAGQPADRELAMLAIHGVLHLLGYDHADPAEERVMFGKTDRILASVFKDITNPQMAQMTQIRTKAETEGRPVRRKLAAVSERAGNLTKVAPGAPARRASQARAGGRPE